MNILVFLNKNAFIFTLIGFAATVAVIIVVLVPVLDERADSTTTTSIPDDTGSGFEPTTTDLSSTTFSGDGSGEESGSGFSPLENSVFDQRIWRSLLKENNESDEELDLISEGFIRIQQGWRKNS